MIYTCIIRCTAILHLYSLESYMTREYKCQGEDTIDLSSILRKNWGCPSLAEYKTMQLCYWCFVGKAMCKPPSVGEKAVPFLRLFRLNQPFCNSTWLRWDNLLLLLVTRVTTPPLKGWCAAHQNCVFSWNVPSSGAPPTQTWLFGRPFNRLNEELFGLKLEVGAPDVSLWSTCIEKREQTHSLSHGDHGGSRCSRYVYISCQL